MILIIAGGREFDDYEYFCEVVDDYLNKNDSIHKIISGGARGVDTMARIYCEEKNIDFQEFPADWDTFGKGAGPIRNKKMAQVGTHLLAFWDLQSRGTKHMIETARNLDLEVFVVEY